MPTISVLSIAHPLLEDLSLRPFFGRVLGLYNRACNLVDATNRVIALTLPEIGNGPFSIVIESDSNLSDILNYNQPVTVTHQLLIIDDRHIPLNTAEIWVPKVVYPEKPLNLTPAIAKIIQPYVDWPPPAQETPIARSTTRLIYKAGANLKQTIVLKKGIEEAVAQLAGLGNGLTPAGDDYLVGVMAALWLTGRAELPPKIAQIAIPKTTALSAAFLKAAAKGEFIEPWPKLVQALLAEDAIETAKATRRISQFGASSGLDALAGFTTIILSLVHHHHEVEGDFALGHAV